MKRDQDDEDIGFSQHTRKSHVAGCLFLTTVFSFGHNYAKFNSVKQPAITSFPLFLTAINGQIQYNFYKSKSFFMIRHTVIFTLKYPKGSPEEIEFLQAAAKLSSIPGVNNFESLRQISRKNDFDYGLSMEFKTLKDYEEYNQHPDHTKFVETYWVKYVEKFLETDYEPIKQ